MQGMWFQCKQQQIQPNKPKATVTLVISGTDMIVVVVPQAGDLNSKFS